MNTQTTFSTAFQRGVSFCLAAVVTLGLLGGIDQLAQHPGANTAADPAWAAHTGTAASTPAGASASRG